MTYHDGYVNVSAAWYNRNGKTGAARISIRSFLYPNAARTAANASAVFPPSGPPA